MTYERLDSSHVHVPAVTVCRSNDTGQVEDYQIFVDLAPLTTPQD